MAAPATNWFRKVVEDALENTQAIDLNADTIKTALYTDAAFSGVSFDTNIGYGATPWNDANHEVANGNGYTTGGFTHTVPALTVAGGTITFDVNEDAQWTDSTITARGALVYDSTAPGSNAYGLVFFNFGGDKVSTSGTFTVQWSASGILTFS